MLQMIRIAVRNLMQHKLRSSLLGGAIAAVTSFLLLMTALAAGMRENMFISATTLMTGHVNVGGFYKVTPGQSAPVVTESEKIVELIRSEVPGVDYITSRGRGWAAVISETASVQLGVTGIDITREPGLRQVIDVVEGDLDELTKPNTVLVFENQAKKLGVKAGDSLTISAPTPRGVNNTLDVKVAVVAKEIGLLSSFGTFIEANSLRQLYQLKNDTTGVLQIYLKDVSEVPKVQQLLRDKFAAAGYRVMENDPRAFWEKFESVNREDWTGQSLDVTNWEDEISFLKYADKLITSLAFMVASIMLVIICIGIMMVLWISIRERTREIGTLRAIGMQRPSVMLMFVTEGLLLGFLSTLVGAALGLLAIVAANYANIGLPVGVQLFLMSDHLVLLPSLRWVIATIVLITASTTFVSLFPSFFAAKLKPITAMQHAG